MNKKIMLLLNPVAGNGTSKNLLFPVLNGFMELEDHVCVYLTQYQGHGSKLISTYASTFDLIVCSGGDGTLNEAISGLMDCEKKPSLCYIPSGTVNDFASTLQLPNQVPEVFELIKRDTKFQCDIGHFNDKYFAYVAAFGAFSDVSYTTPQSFKNIFGKMAYFIEGIRTIPNIKGYNVHIESDITDINDTIIFGCISNAKSVGGFQSVSTKNAELDDGLFEVLLIKPPQNPLDLQTILTALLRQEVNEKFMYFFRTSKLKITCSEPLRWTLDGEDGGSCTEAVITNINKALTILV